MQPQLWHPPVELSELDVDWDNSQQRSAALSQILAALEATETWLTQPTQIALCESVCQSLGVARQVQTQDVEVASDGSPQLKHGVAKNRRLSVEDPTTSCLGAVDGANYLCAANWLMGIVAIAQDD